MTSSIETPTQYPLGMIGSPHPLETLVKTFHVACRKWHAQRFGHPMPSFRFPF